MYTTIKSYQLNEEYKGDEFIMDKLYDEKEIDDFTKEESEFVSSKYKDYGIIELQNKKVTYIFFKIEPTDKYKCVNIIIR